MRISKEMIQNCKGKKKEIRTKEKEEFKKSGRTRKQTLNSAYY